MRPDAEEQLVRMGKGIPGAPVVIARLLKERPDGQSVVDALDELQLYGSDIWLGFKDHCRQDLSSFAKAVLAKDEAMLATIRAGRDP